MFPHNAYVYCMSKKLLLYPAYFVAVAFPLLLHLEKRTVRLWDEALFALRALYMSENHKLLYDFSQFDQLPYHLNTKPVFASLFQVISFKFLGYNELALRLPMALFSFLTIAIMIWAGKKIFNNIWIGLASGLILVTSLGYIKVHVARGGEQDAALACLMFISMTSFYCYSQYLNDKQRKKFLLVCTISIIAAVLTKLIVGLFFIPGFLIYLIHTKKLKIVLTDKTFYANLISALVLIVSYYLLIDHFNSGYLKRLWEYEFTGRFLQAIETESLAWNYYLQNWIEGNFRPWFFMMILAVWWIRKSKNKLYKDYIILSLYCISIYSIIISFSQTKKFWYNAPLYPIISMLAAIGLIQLYHYLDKNKKLLTIRNKILFGSFVVLLFAIPYSLVIDQIYWPKNHFKADKYGYLFRKIEISNPDITKFTIAIADFGASAAFYQQAYNIEKGYDIKLSRQANYKTGDFVLCCLNNAFNPIYKKYITEQVQFFDECKMLKILGLKEILKVE